jgi:Glycosyl hydrolase family 59
MNKRNTLLYSCLLSAALLAQTASHALAITPINITVKQGARQKFQGMGFSMTSSDSKYQTLTQTQKNTLQKLLCKDAKFKVLRLWFKTDKYAPQPGVENTALFVKRFIESGFISDALANGCTTLLLAPDAIPPYMGSTDSQYIQSSQITNYAALLANFIFKIKHEHGVKINATGILNEPNDTSIKIGDSQWPVMVKALRQELDNRGLKDVKIITPEFANADSIAARVIKAIKSDPDAWKALAAISTHTYNMGAARWITNIIEGTDKEYWMTEAGMNGPEEPGDAEKAASAASRFLSDMNNRVTHWIWFIGFAKAHAADDSTRIVRYFIEPFSYDIFQKYYYFLQLNRTFDFGAIFRQSISSLEGEMTWTSGRKPRITVASAKNPDGTWGIAISNYTSDKFAIVPPPSLGLPPGTLLFHSQGGRRAETFAVTVFVEELAQTGDIRMKMYRSNSNVNNVYIGTALMRKGTVTIPKVESVDLITLRN